jgi:5-carboxymethyl-2-hydroxymuconate isomerase
MPHCVIECPKELKDIISFDVLATAVHDAAESSGLFDKGDVKSRIVTSDHYVVGGKKDSYVHVVTQLLSGRTIEQRKQLSDAIAKVLCELLPDVEMLSVEVREIEKQVYSNRKSVQNLF